MKKKHAFDDNAVDWVVKEAYAKNEYGRTPKLHKHKSSD